MRAQSRHLHARNYLAAGAWQEAFEMLGTWALQARLFQCPSFQTALGSFKPKMYQNPFMAGALPRTALGSSQRLPDYVVC